jgi:trehalose 6-phosphate phosphatase
MRHFSPGSHARVFRDMRLLLCLDFDGTLAPLRRVPAEARLSKAARSVLAGLVLLPRCEVAVITGRSLGDIEEKVGEPRMIYGADHGFSIRCGRQSFRPPVPGTAVRALKAFHASALGVLRGIHGVLYEDKGVTQTVHFRRVARSSVPAVKEKILSLSRAPAFRKEIEVREGHQCLEIRPKLAWDKGACVAWLLVTLSKEHGPFFPVYIGDDATDEDAFRAVRRLGLTVRVGRKKDSAAEYFVRDTGEVVRALREILRIRKGARS